MPKTKKQFEVLVETKILVDAFDEDAARKKVEKALGSRRDLAPDVSATSSLWIYDVDPVAAATD
jgi:hypothetical protein